ncbi:MAG: DNA replication and repair protein RecF [Candidatus Levybacteria bacterium]|nr:DNA replication and repair protein RecF [Candidatus Levybacteria bacterium]
MILRSIAFSDFRSYSHQVFSFSPKTTIILGPNAIGKSNLIEAIFLISTGKSFKAEKDTQMISFGKNFARVKCLIEEKDAKETLEVIVSQEENSTRSYSKKFLHNGVARRRVDFVGKLPALLFVPSDLDVIVSSPSQRREFLNTVLELTDRQYRIAMLSYEKALRQRNALLGVAQETGIRNDEQFAYWDNLLIEHGSYISKKRRELIEYFNQGDKPILFCSVSYEESAISRERLDQYRGPEIGAGVTLVGPHRDDFTVCIKEEDGEDKNVKFFGSRGQQRLVVLQLKLLQLSYIEKITGERPLLLLDDIFSELDEKHIKDVLDLITKQQTILTTTHEEFFDKKIKADVINLGKI